MSSLDPSSTRSVDARDGSDQATVDLGRVSRCGFGEVIYGEGKSAALVVEIAKAQLAVGQDVLVTRVDPAAAEQIVAEFSAAVYDPIARTIRLGNDVSQSDADCPPGVESTNAESTSVESINSIQAVTPHVAVITAGSTDAPVAAEAIETLRWMRMPLRHYTDIGVAGPQRLLNRIDEIRMASVIIVVAGMEGALPSVVAGHVAVPVIAVPTSVGYGASLDGITPLLSALASCAPGVTTVGIDAGFKGGYIAGMILSQITAAVAKS